MNYYLIKGRFRVVGYSPDGDSLMFEANNKKIWNKIVTGNRTAFEEKLLEKKGVVQLRLQGIDALETHYSPSPVMPPKGMAGKKYSKATKPKMGKFRQPEEYGELATAHLLEQFGVVESKWKNSGWGGRYVSEIKVQKGKTVKTHKKKNSDPLEGYIIVNDMDRKGRPIAWVFGGTTKKRDGSRMTTSALGKQLKSSANYKMIVEGLVYPYFFYTLAASLRSILIQGTNAAQKKKAGLWSIDATAKGITVRTMSKLTGGHLIFPYLFRRLIKHQFLRLNQGYYEAVKKRKAYKPKTQALFLDTFFDDTNPYVFMVREKEFKRLDEIVRVTKTKIMMKTDPGNIVFLG